MAKKKKSKNLLWIIISTIAIIGMVFFTIAPGLSGLGY